ncbi:MAG: polyhydroxyalkanoic acid system family protein [Gammaproteobacteria bacterium]|nr:polyhydroxyalkanoic acid system family protein [Gammaproteobacteria bacterium]
MAHIRINRAHSMDNKSIREEVQKLADKLSQELEARYQWNGDRLEFERSGASGFIAIGENNLNIELKLGMLLSPFKGKVEQSISEYLDRHLV